jgi:hypothetical protein
LPERLRKLPRTRGFFFNPSIDGGFELLEPVQPQSPPKLGVPRAKRFDLALQRGNQLFDIGRKAHSTYESENARDVAPNPNAPPNFHPPVTFRTHHGLGVTLQL